MTSVWSWRCGSRDVPDVRRNLISGSSLIQQGNKIVIETNKVVISMNNVFVGKGNVVMVYLIQI